MSDGIYTLVVIAVIIGIVVYKGQKKSEREARERKAIERQALERKQKEESLISSGLFQRPLIARTRDLVHGLLVCMALDMQSQELVGGEIVCVKVRSTIKNLLTELSNLGTKKEYVDACLLDDQLLLDVATELKQNYTAFSEVSKLDIIMSVGHLRPHFFELAREYNNLA